MFKEYDLLVVGAGHAGAEAAAAAANLGSSVLLITMDMGRIAQMSCNPAMGGIAKGQIVREIDALGGYSGIVSDKTAIQFRMLNRSKGPAMWSPRTQNDRSLFTLKWREMLENTPNLDFWQDTVTSLIVENKIVKGVKTSLGIKIKSKAVVLTNGTFLNGLIHIGRKQFGGGRAGEGASTGITEQLITLGFESDRMKTGTPPRIDGRSLDYSLMEEQFGDEQPNKFSYTDTKPLSNQRSCFITYTNPIVHDVLREGFADSPMFNGAIQGIGPRYCPSVEDKINRFADKDRHQIFVEPEGWNTCEIYVNGFSTSLAEDIQLKAIRKIDGFANAKMFRPGYAIEYDFFQPTQLKNTLETKLIFNLYFAGQINGTTGYEEAAGQGLMAGINAHQKINEKDSFVLKRNEAYIGVLIDDLISKGTDEPYRMFTSRAEYRILLRQDNADVRLTEKSNSIGLASNERLKKVECKTTATKTLLKAFKTTSIEPSVVNDILFDLNTSPIKQKTKLYNLIARPQITANDILKLSPVNEIYLATKNKEEVLEQVEILSKYESYIEKEKEGVEKMKKLESVKLHEEFDYHKLLSLSIEARQKLTIIKPATIGQASRISGVSPSDISVLLVFLGR